jgi:hypothetical protein
MPGGGARGLRAHARVGTLGAGARGQRVHTRVATLGGGAITGRPAPRTR